MVYQIKILTLGSSLILAYRQSGFIFHRLLLLNGRKFSLILVYVYAISFYCKEFDLNKTFLNMIFTSLI